MGSWQQIPVSALNRLKKLVQKDYRDAYLDNIVRSGVAYQVQALRRKTGLSQTDFAKKLGKPQSAICRLEQETYGRVSLTTLLDIAKALDVGLVVRFTDYVGVLNSAARMSDRDLMPNTIHETVGAVELGRHSGGGALAHVDKLFGESSNPQSHYGTSRNLDRGSISALMTGSVKSRASTNWLDTVQ